MALVGLLLAAFLLGGLMVSLPAHAGLWWFLQAGLLLIATGVGIRLSRTQPAEKDSQAQEQNTQTLELLYDVAARINVSEDLSELLTGFLEKLSSVLHARAATARVLTDDGWMRLVASIGLDQKTIERERLLPVNKCMSAKASKSGELVVETNPEICRQIMGQANFSGATVHMIAVPLPYKGRTLGVYNLFVDDEGLDRVTASGKLLTSIGQNLGLAIDKARLGDEADRLPIVEERQRLAHDLHDSLAQTLASLRIQVRVLDETLHQGDDSAIWQEMERVESSLDEATFELRDLIARVRAPKDHRGLIPAVEDVVARFRNESEVMTFVQNEWHDMALPTDLEIQVVGIVQEALVNIRKHSHAKSVRVILRSGTGGENLVLIEDDGVGFSEPAVSDHPGEHLGLQIMRERAQQLGGELRIESEPGEGTRLELTFRYPRQGSDTPGDARPAPN